MKKHEYKVNVRLGDYGLDSNYFNNLKDARKYINDYTTEDLNENLFGMVSYLDLQFIITDSKGQSIAIE